jgi:chromosome segregation ATPase
MLRISRLLILFYALLLQLCGAQESNCDVVCESTVKEAVAAARQELEGHLSNKVDELEALKRVLEAAISRRNEMEKRTAIYVKELHEVKREVDDLKSRARDTDAALSRMKEEIKISQERLFSVTDQMMKKDLKIQELEAVGIVDLLMKRANLLIETVITSMKGSRMKEQDL